MTETPQPPASETKQTILYVAIGLLGLLLLGWAAGQLLAYGDRSTPTPTASVTETLAATATELPVEPTITLPAPDAPTETLAPSPAPIEMTQPPPPVDTDVPSLPTGIAPSETPVDFTPSPEMSSTPLTAGGRLGVQAVSGLRVQGTTLVNADGSRFIVSGVNLEMYRDYTNGCGWVTDGQYAIRGVIADKLKALKINAVRLNYSYRNLTGSNLSKFLDMAQELAARGLYVMPSDHTYTGDVLTNAAASWPTMKQIVDGFTARGIGQYLIMNPYNEPGPDISAAQWITAQKNVITYLRDQVGYTGVIVLDGSGWATLLDENAFQQVINFDAGKLGGTGNIVFSMHLYPNITTLPAKLWEAAKRVPLTVGELGQENPGASPLDQAYVRKVINDALTIGIPNGHNGLWGWIWAWCDTNKMLEDWENPAVAYSAASTLSSHGVIWRDNYYSKVPSSQPPPAVTLVPPTPVRSNTPSPTRTASTTPSPTPSPTPVRSNTPTPTYTPSPSPSPTATPDSLEHWQFDLRFENGRLFGDIYRLQ